MTLHVLFWIQYIIPSHLGFPMNMGKKIIDDNRHKVMTIPNIDFRSRCNKNVKRSCTGTLLLGIALDGLLFFLMSIGNPSWPTPQDIV
jgi:hypothetical protein